MVSFSCRFKDSQVLEEFLQLLGKEVCQIKGWLRKWEASLATLTL